MKIVVDETIPFVRGVFEPFAEVAYRDGSEIGRKDLVDADALVIRTRTICNAELLEGTAVKIIATASTGMDNIDIPYCKTHSIFLKNADGCNSGGVMNYVFSALYGCAARKSIPLTGSTFGIVGVGSAGQKVEKMARFLGFKVLLCDPLRAEEEGDSQFCSLDFLLENSDIVTLHLPLNEGTKRMANADFFRKMRLGAFFINAARGELVVEDDLIEAIPKLGPVVIDTWNNEPYINRKLMDMVDIATPHIAGYSYQGKQISAMMSVRSVARFFGISELYEFYPKTDVQELEAVKLDVSGMNQGQIASLIQYNYPIFTDDFMFRTNPAGFTELRTNYQYRREFYID